MNYSYGHTILTWTDDPAVNFLINKIAESLKLVVYEASIESDIYAVPYFFAIFDAKKLRKETITILKEVLIYENAKEFLIIIQGDTAVKIPGSIKKYFKKLDGEITEANLRTLVLNKNTAIIRHRNNKKSYDKIIFRTIYILRKLMQKDIILKIEDLCSEFNVSEKTIKRDIELLRSMGEDIEYDKMKRGYCLKHSLINI